MFDCTVAQVSETQLDGSLPSSLVFPAFSRFSEGKPQSLGWAHWPAATEKELPNPNNKLLENLHQTYIFAKHTFSELDGEKLKTAFSEARVLASSALFIEELSPSVSVDPYGEFTFFHRSEAGYVDIGVRGEGELSYHVRNDVDPSETKFDDHYWEDYSIPLELVNALRALRKNL